MKRLCVLMWVLVFSLSGATPIFAKYDSFCKVYEIEKVEILGSVSCGFLSCGRTENTYKLKNGQFRTGYPELNTLYDQKYWIEEKGGWFPSCHMPESTEIIYLDKEEDKSNTQESLKNRIDDLEQRITDLENALNALITKLDLIISKLTK
jgi:hypothetical protein